MGLLCWYPEGPGPDRAWPYFLLIGSILVGEPFRARPGGRGSLARPPVAGGLGGVSQRAAHRGIGLLVAQRDYETDPISRRDAPSYLVR
jgi:hypothetical protein